MNIEVINTTNRISMGESNNYTLHKAAELLSNLMLPEETTIEISFMKNDTAVNTYRITK